MPKSITSGVAKLSLERSKRTKKKTTREERRQKRLLYEEWVYGYHLKNKHLRIASDEKFNLPWQTRPGPVMMRLTAYFERASGVPFAFCPVRYRNRPGRILTFVKDDGRKRLEKNTFSHEDMEKVREIIGLPSGTKPKWLMFRAMT